VRNADRSSGNTSPSPTWAAIKTFFTLPSTGPGSCIDVALSAVKPGLDMARSAAQNATKYGVPAANALSAGAMSTAVDLNNMLRARQLDPFLGPAVATAATATAATLSTVVPAVIKAIPYAFFLTTDAVFAYGVIKEGVAAARGQCKP
jgi:hypothetical protein